ncbi:MAG: DUF2911 domain-containing protein [Gemmatimonas sp.]
MISASAQKYLLSAAFAAASLLPEALTAQGYPPSQRGSVVQNIALTKVTVTYGRPVARGRALFGALVPWDSVWHPGADSATRVVFSRDVVLEGQPLKAGTYSLWLVPRAAGPWTFILSKSAFVDHKAYAGPTRDAVRVDVAPDSLSSMESMAIYFPRVLRDEGSMRIHWGTSAVTVNIKAAYRPN